MVSEIAQKKPIIDVQSHATDQNRVNSGRYFAGLDFLRWYIFVKPFKKIVSEKNDGLGAIRLAEKFKSKARENIRRTQSFR